MAVDNWRRVVAREGPTTGQWPLRHAGGHQVVVWETMRGNELFRLLAHAGQWDVLRFSTEAGRYTSWSPHLFPSAAAARRWVDDAYPPTSPPRGRKERPVTPLDPEAWGFSRRRSRSDRLLGRR